MITTFSSNLKDSEMNSPRHIISCLFWVVAVFTVFVLWGESLPAKEPQENYDRWKDSIIEFKLQDEVNPPAQNGILFVGSSSIRLWDLKKSFPELELINRGFGGSQISDSIHYVDLLVLKHRPRLVVMYAGDNDISRKKTPERVARDFKKFADLIHAELPDTKLIYIAIKPSLSRWKLFEKMDAANQLIKQQCTASEKLTYLDIVTPMLNEEGNPKPELFIKDGLHLNARGYEVWSDLLRPYLK